MLDFEDIIGFDWDEGNSFKNEEKHNVSIKDCEEVFKNEPLVAPGKLSNNETRFIALGENDYGKPLAVIFTIRQNRIRVISARPQSKKERKFYYGK